MPLVVYNMFVFLSGIVVSVRQLNILKNSGHMAYDTNKGVGMHLSPSTLPSEILRYIQTFKRRIILSQHILPAVLSVDSRWSRGVLTRWSPSVEPKKKTKSKTLVKLLRRLLQLARYWTFYSWLFILFIRQCDSHAVFFLFLFFFTGNMGLVTVMQF